ncbi:DNA helicase RecG, partial [Streptococcus suis]
NDLLTYYPFRYEDLESKSIYDLQDGEKAVVVGEVVSPANVQYYGYKRNILRFSIKHGEVVLSVSFFNNPYLSYKNFLGHEI